MDPSTTLVRPFRISCSELSKKRSESSAPMNSVTGALLFALRSRFSSSNGPVGGLSRSTGSRRTHRQGLGVVPWKGQRHLPGILPLPCRRLNSSMPHYSTTTVPKSGQSVVGDSPCYER